MCIRTIVIDDVPLAISKLEGFVKQVQRLDLLQSFDNALDAISYMQSNTVNLVFLDIQMEAFTGLQFMDALQVHPQIIIVSAYSEYAVNGFEHNVTDYLLKPYSFERFLKAVDKVFVKLQKQQSKDFIFVKTEYRMERVDFNDILYIIGKGAYLQIVKVDSMSIMTLMNFEQVMNLLPNDEFVRVHRSYIVALSKIESIERNIIRIAKMRIPIGKSYQDAFYDKI